jgi:hypothetical protein
MLIVETVTRAGAAKAGETVPGRDKRVIRIPINSK